MEFVREVCNLYFNPRPPRGGRRRTAFAFAVTVIFQSTPSARRATYSRMPSALIVLISIHALREEGDVHADVVTAEDARFQSTPSARRATDETVPMEFFVSISIHALREEGDKS